MISIANISAFPVGAQASPFSWDIYERATRIHVPLVHARTGLWSTACGSPAVPVANPFQHLKATGAVR